MIMSNLTSNSDLIGTDESTRNQWCSKLACSRTELEGAIAQVGISALPVRMQIIRNRLTRPSRARVGHVALAWKGVAGIMTN